MRLGALVLALTGVILGTMQMKWVGYGAAILAVLLSEEVGRMRAESFWFNLFQKYNIIATEEDAE